MSVPLRVLIVEDSEDDALLLLRTLRKGGYDVIHRQVDTAQAMEQALHEEWDVVISDYSMPSFSGLGALSLLRQAGLDTPFFLVSGAIGEEMAVEAMRTGANDYVMKDSLSRLVPSIQRELRDADSRRERRRAELALAESEERFRRLAENAQDIIFRYEIHPRPHFAYVGPAATEMTGYTPEEHYDNPSLHTALVHPADRKLIQGLSDEEVVALCQPIRWRHRDGRTVWVEKRSVLVPDDDGGLLAVEGVIRDISERKEMEARLLRAERLETAGKIAGQMAHDFNNLLTPLAGYPQLIKRRLPEGSPAIRYCDIMVESVQRMADINEDLLALGRRGHFEQQVTDLNQVVEQALEHLARVPDSLRVTSHLAEDLLAVKGSHAQLLRVVTNLLTNAREAMQDEGTISVRTENVYVDRPMDGFSRIDVGEYVRLEVADSGSGISPEVRERIFDAFFTTKTTGKRRGSGLGLSVVQSIVDDHGGHLELDSEVNRGSTFSIYLPVLRQAAADVHLPEELRGGTESILVVDDDPLQREVASELLQSLGYRVDAVDSGEEAVAFLGKQNVDLLVLDMIMPGMDGAETFRRVHELRPDQRAIIVSGYSESERVLEARKLGAGLYVRKPITLEKLGRAVRAELDRAPVS